MRAIFVTFLVTFVTCGCTTDESETIDGIVVNYDKDCTTVIELRNGTAFEYPEDADNLVIAEESCIKQYGSDSCLSRFIKTGKLSYYAVCKKIDN